MKYIVYLTTNLINNKIYIGVHQTLNPDIFDGYLGCDTWTTRPSSYMHPETAFQYAVKKYGPKNFKRIVLYVYSTDEEAYKKEAEIVDENFIKQPNNYNMVVGGKGGVGKKLPLYQFNLEGNLIKKWDTTEEAIQFFSTTYNSFSTSMQFKEKLFGFFWSRESNINIEEYSKGDYRKCVYKYDSESGKCLFIYNSIYEAAKVENIDRTQLTVAIKLESLVHKQYYFSEKLYDEFVKSPRKSLKGKSFYLYSLNGEYINIFNSGKDLMNFLNTKSWNTIYRAINAQNGIYKDYQIKLEYNGNKIEKAENKSKAKKVNVYTSTGEFIKTCDSVQKAAFEFNAKTSSINRVLRGLAHTANNYVFKWVN